MSDAEQAECLHGLLAPSLAKEKKEKFVQEFIDKGQELSAPLAAAKKKKKP